MFSIALLLNEVFEKEAKFETKLPKISPKVALKFTPKVLVQEPKKEHKHKEFGQKSPLPDPPPQGTPDPTNSLCWGPSEYRKKAYTKNFEGGILEAPKFFTLDFFACFFRT